MREVGKIALQHRLNVRLILLFSTLLILGMAVGLWVAQKIIRKDFHRVLAEQIDIAGIMAENTFKQVGQTGFLFIEQINRDLALHDAIDDKNNVAIKTAMDRLASDSKTDCMILLTPQGKILYHSKDKEQIGKSRIYQHIVKQAILENKAGISIFQEMNNFLIYSSGFIKQVGKNNKVKAIVLAGYAVNDQMIRNISENSKIGITMIRRRAIIASTFDRDRSILQDIPMQWTEYQMLLADKDNTNIITFNNKRYFVAANRLAMMDPLQEGSILYTLQTNTFESIISRLYIQFGVIFALVFIVGLLLYSFFTHRLLSPLHQLVMLSNDKTHFSNTDILIKRKDEVGELATYISKLIQNIKEQNKDLEKKVQERTKDLQKSLEEVKTLRGIIPICSYCKKIRDDQGAWDIIEAYICNHSDAQFSHGICPECYKEQVSNFKK